MAQNTCQQMPTEDFYQLLRGVLSRTYDQMDELKRTAEFLASMDATTLNNMETKDTVVIEIALRTTLGDCRTAINEILDFYEGTAVTQTKPLKDEINKLRYI